MRYLWRILFICFLTTALLACQAASSPMQIPQESLVQTEPSESTTESSGRPTLAPTLSSEANMTPVVPTDETAEKMVALVKAHLAQKLSIAVDQIMLADVKPVIWRDAGLGCPKPGVDYIQMETPGYNILLEAGGKTYTYHTDETKRFVQCNK